MTAGNNIDRIEEVLNGLGEHADEVIFIGGACLQFYVSDSELREFRQTKDIDCLVEILSYSEFSRFSDKLRTMGFAHDTSPGAPINRWIYNGILVDTIPDKTSVIGFEERNWFIEGRKHSITKRLPSGSEIRILPLSFFIAAKLEAFAGRGKGDFMGNHDIEDVITLIDGNDDLTEILTAPPDVKDYITAAFNDLLGNDDFIRSVTGHIGYESSAAERAGMVIEKMREIIH